MLKGIHSAIPPELLKIMAEMGHGEELVLADAHFPAKCYCPLVLRADGCSITRLLDGIIPLFELDTYDDPLIMMAPVPGDSLDPRVEEGFMAAIRRHAPQTPLPIRMERFAFYNRSRKSAACVVTGEVAKYGNLILKKGVTADTFDYMPAWNNHAC